MEARGGQGSKKEDLGAGNWDARGSHDLEAEPSLRVAAAARLLAHAPSADAASCLLMDGTAAAGWYHLQTSGFLSANIQQHHQVLQYTL